MAKAVVRYRLSDREINNILFALRNLQSRLSGDPSPRADDFFKSSRDIMTVRQIDKLCEQLNTGGRDA